MLACYKLKQRRVIFTVAIQATGQMKAIYASGDRWYSINVGRTVAYCLEGLRFDPRPLQVMNQSVLEQDTECQLAPNAAPVVSGPSLRMVTADVQAVLSRVVAATSVWMSEYSISNCWGQGSVMWSVEIEKQYQLWSSLEENGYKKKKITLKENIQHILSYPVMAAVSSQPGVILCLIPTHSVNFKLGEEVLLIPKKPPQYNPGVRLQSGAGLLEWQVFIFPTEFNCLIEIN